MEFTGKSKRHPVRRSKGSSRVLPVGGYGRLAMRIIRAVTFGTLTASMVLILSTLFIEARENTNKVLYRYNTVEEMKEIYGGK